MERVSTVFIAAAACLLLLVLQAHASGPTFNEVSAAREPPAPGLGRIFIYRTTVFGAAIQPSIVVNGETVGSAEPRGFFFLDRPPGDYTITMATEVERSLSLTLDAGQIRYVQLGVTEGFFVVHVYPRLINPAKGAVAVASLTYTGVPGAPQIAAMPAPAAAPGAGPASSALPPPAEIGTPVQRPPAAPAPAMPIAIAAPSPPPVVAPPPAVQPRPHAVSVAAVPRSLSGRVPYLDDAHQIKFQEYLQKPKPRAFAISDNGHFAAIWGAQSSDAANRALQGCRTAAGKDCVLYAVDDVIVFNVE